MSVLYPAVKRALDLALAIAGGLVALVPCIIVAFAIRMSMGRPVLFTQARAGKGGHPFDLLKFRTMRQATTGEWDPTTDGDRLTTLGRWLRRWSLDELPQLVNVIRGDMSLVGPRPLPLRYRQRYSPAQARRLEAVPGITGWAQINGRNATTWENRFALDVWYVDHRSLALDIRILLLTLRRVIEGQGVTSEGQATMTEFMGQ